MKCNNFPIGAHKSRNWSAPVTQSVSTNTAFGAHQMKIGQHKVNDWYAPTRQLVSTKQSSGAHQPNDWCAPNSIIY